MNILIVDDHPVNLKLLAAQLEAEGHAVIQASNGFEALAALKNKPVDAIISDVLMPVMDGYRLCHEVRSHATWKQLPFIFYSATYLSAGDEKLALDLGADAFLCKPLPAEAIVETLYRVMGRTERPQPKAGIAGNDVLKEYSERLVKKIEETNTQLMEQAEALKGSELRYRRLFQSAQDGILILDAQTGVVIDVNPFLIMLLGFPYEQVLGKAIWELKPFQTFLANEDQFNELKAREYIRYENLLLDTVDGNRIEVEFTSNVYLVEDARVIQCNIRDMTDRYRAEAALRESEARLAAAQALAHLGSWELNLVTSRGSWSAEMSRLHNRNPALPPPTFPEFLDLIHPDDRVILQEAQSYIPKAALPFTREYRTNPAMGPLRHLLVSIQVKRDAAGRATQATGITLDITERVEQLNSLRESEARLNEAQHNAHIGSWRFIPPGTTIWSDEMYELFQLPRNMPVTYETIRSRIHPEDSKNRLPLGLAIEAGASDYRAEYRLVWPDGQIRTVLTLGNIRRNKDGQVIEAVGTLQDVTESKAAETALRESEELFSKAFRLSPDCLMIVRMPDRIVLRANDALCDLLRCTPEEIIGRSSRDFLTWVNDDERLSFAQTLDRNGECRYYETVFRMADGRLVNLNISSRKIIFNKAPCILTVLRDVTEEKRTKQALIDSELRYRSLFENAPDGIVISNTDNRFVQVNTSICQMLGYTPDELVGQSATIILADKQDSRIGGSFEYLKTHSVYHQEWLLRRKDGSVFISEAFAAVMPNGSLLATIRDITERKQMEQATRASEEYFRFLNSLVDATRTLGDPEKIMAVTARMLGQHLNASRCAYADVDQDGDQFSILHDYTDNCPSTVGHYRLSLFGTRAVTTLQGAQTLVIRDVDKEINQSAEVDMFNAIGIKAVICCPLVKDGSLRAMMAVHQITPRDWKPGEITLVQEVVERCWATIERRTAETNLRQSEALMRIAGRAARMGAWAVELPEGRITWSDEVCAIHEIPPGTVPELEAAINFYAPHARETIRNAFTACVEEGIPYDLELEMITAKGRPIWVRAIGEAQRNAEGVVICVQGAFQEITERKQAEKEIHRLNAELEQRVIERTAQLEAANQELRDSRAELNSIFESLPGLYVVLTPDFKIVSVSDAYLIATLTTREGILGRNIFEVFPDNPNDLDANGVSNLKASLDRVLRNAAPDTMAIQKYDVRRPDGVFEEHYWSPVNSPVFGANRRIKYIVHRAEEVTEFVKQKQRAASGETVEFSAQLQQMEVEVFLSSKKLQDANQKLEAANKELEAFSYTISHDLRAPLRAVDGYSQSVMEDFGPLLPEEGKRQLSVVRASAQRMGELIDDLLSFARLSRSSLNKQVVDTDALVRAVLTEMKEEYKDRQVEINIGSLAPCEGDPALLKQVWVNLLSNAIKYSRKREHAIVEIGCLEQNVESVYFVRDNGSGFDMRYASKLFGVFQRLHRVEDFEGTGVGLAITQRIIHRHGGRIWAESSVDRGATFYFSLQGEEKS